MCSCLGALEGGGFEIKLSPNSFPPSCACLLHLSRPTSHPLIRLFSRPLFRLFSRPLFRYFLSSSFSFFLFPSRPLPHPLTLSLSLSFLSASRCISNSLVVSLVVSRCLSLSLSIIIFISHLSVAFPPSLLPLCPSSN